MPRSCRGERAALGSEGGQGPAGQEGACQVGVGLSLTPLWVSSGTQAPSKATSTDWWPHRRSQPHRAGRQPRTTEEGTRGS